MTGIILIGCGAVSRRYHAPALRELERAREVQVVGLVDPDPAALAALGKAFPDAVRHENLSSLSGLGADIAIVASPPSFHADQTIQAHRSGLSVLCEKPMATSTDEGRSMIDAAKTADRVLAIGLVRRFLPAVHTIRYILRHDLLGEVISFTGFEGGLFDWPVSSSAYFTDSRGGVLFDLGSHALDLAFWWFGEPEGITYEDDAMGGVDVNCHIQLQLRGGAAGDIRLSRDWRRPNEYRIQCAGGWLRWIVNEASAVRMGFADSPHALDARLFVAQRGMGCEPGPATFERCFVEQIRDVVAAHRGQAASRVPGEEGLRALRLIESCYRRRAPMRVPWLSEWERAGRPGIQVIA